MTTTSQDMTARVMAAFTGGVIERVRVSAGYRLGMLGVLLGLVVMPLLYVAMIAGACWLLVWHVRHDFVWLRYIDVFSPRTFQMFIGASIAYVGLAVAGVIFILFLFRPLFTPSPKEPPPVTLDPITEPALFALIHRICDLIGAPRPTEVRVDCRVNASAGFRRGVASFIGNDLVLTIGMPLVAGLSVQQLAGVLAHEFGHFGQGSGMRVDYLVRHINAWFGRLVYGRDPWDAHLDTMEDKGGPRRFVALMAKGMIWLGRLLLEFLMNMGGALSGVMSRQMEFDADAYAAQVVGSRGFAEILLRLPVLAHAQEMVGQEMFTLLKSGSLPDNVPCRVSRHEEDMTDLQREKLRKKALARDAEWWHTHPCLAQRREALADLGARGVFHLDDPAALLFTDFRTLCKTVSAYWYEVEAGLDLNCFDLVDMDGMAKRHHVKETHEEAVREIFGGLPSPHRLIPLPDAAPDHAAQVALVEAWKADYGSACLKEKEMRDTTRNQVQGCHMARIGFAPHTLDKLGVNMRSLEAALTAQEAGQQAYLAFSGQMRVFEQAAWGRIAAALEARYQRPGTEQEWRLRVGLLVEAQRALATAVEHLVSAWLDASMVSFASENASHYSGGHDLKSILREYDKRVKAALQRVMTALGTAVDPFAEKARKLADTLRLLKLPAEGEFYSLECYTPLMSAVHENVNMVTGELCELASEVERGMTSEANMRRAYETAPEAAWQAPAMVSS